MSGSKQEAAICAFSSDTHIKNIEKTEREVFPLKKIASFTIDHIKLQPGIYVSRKDHIGADTITTFDLRMTSPNEEPVMNTAELHTIEHLGATFLRNHPTFADKTVYFGPMGCRTGFYLLLAGDYESKDIVPLVTEMFTFIRDFHDEVPGASPKDCGNYLDMNLSMANYLAKKYLDELKENEFDIIVLDPPAFTKSRRTVQKAYNGYKRINKQAMKVLKNGGYLITCSCSRFMETANFEKMLREAASEAGVVLKQVSVTQQNADHPILWTMEETSYLKFYIFQII